MHREASLVSWKNIREEVLQSNAELGKIIDHIDPNDEYKFVKAKYLFGDIIVKQGEAQIPVNNILTPLTHNSIDKNIHHELSYGLLPLFFTLDKNIELFITTGKRDIPVNIFHKGQLTGVYETMDYMMGRKSEPIWNFSAGSRSIFMLPKITDKICLERLKKNYNIPVTAKISKLSDHWQIFKYIAQSENFIQNWQCTVLYFGKKWLDNNSKSNEWADFRDYLQHIIWDHANYAISKIKFNMCWESFAETISARRLQPKPYLIDQVKHLLSIVDKNFPAFVVTDNSQESAPTSGLQQVFTEIFMLKQYLPTIMHICMPNDNIVKPAYVYYSLNFPTILEGSPIKRNTSTIAKDLRDIKLLIETLKTNVKNNIWYKPNKITHDAEFSYFHYIHDVYHQIQSSEDIIIEDKSFLRDQSVYPDRTFCPTSPFFSGCIRINTSLINK